MILGIKPYYKRDFYILLFQHILGNLVLWGSYTDGGRASAGIHRTKWIQVCLCIRRSGVYDNTSCENVLKERKSMTQAGEIIYRLDTIWVAESGCKK